MGQDMASRPQERQTHTANLSARHEPCAPLRVENYFFKEMIFLLNQCKLCLVTPLTFSLASAVSFSEVGGALCAGRGGNQLHTPRVAGAGQRWPSAARLGVAALAEAPPWLREQCAWLGAVVPEALGGRLPSSWPVWAPAFILVSPPGTGRVPGRRTEDAARSLSLDVPSRALPEDPAATSFSHRPEACHMVTSGSKGGWGMPFMKWRTVPRGTKCPVGREEGVRWRVGDGQVCEKHRRALGGEAGCGCTWDVCAWVRVTHACVHVCACCVRTMRCGMRVIVAQVHV